MIVLGAVSDGAKKVMFVTALKSTIFDPALLDLEVAIAKNVIYLPRNE